MGASIVAVGAELRQIVGSLAQSVIFFPESTIKTSGRELFTISRNRAFWTYFMEVKLYRSYYSQISEVLEL